MDYIIYHKLQKALKFCDIWPYDVLFGERYKVGCRKHCHCYCTTKTWKHAKMVAIMISKMPNHKECLIDIHDGQSGIKIGFMNGIMGLIWHGNLITP